MKIMKIINKRIKQQVRYLTSKVVKESLKGSISPQQASAAKIGPANKPSVKGKNQFPAIDAKRVHDVVVQIQEVIKSLNCTAKLLSQNRLDPSCDYLDNYLKSLVDINTRSASLEKHVEKAVIESQAVKSKRLSKPVK
jgi:hypothetical protein